MRRPWGRLWSPRFTYPSRPKSCTPAPDPPPGGPNDRAPPNGHCPPRWRRFLVTTATCGQGGSGRSRHCRGSARVPQGSAPHRGRAHHRVPTPLPGPHSGPGRGRGQAAGSLFPQPERSGGGKGSAPPLPAQPAPRATAEPAAEEEETWVGSPGRRKGPVQRFWG